MSFERPRSILQRLAGAVWVMVMAFLALAEPAHAAFGSGVGAALFQVVAAALVGCAFAARDGLRRSSQRARARFVRWAREREVRSSVALDGGEHARSHS